MNCLCAIYVNRNQRALLAQMTSFVMWYDVIYHSSLSILNIWWRWGGGGVGLGDSPGDQYGTKYKISPY